VTTLGIDAASMGAVHDGAPAHQEALGRGMLFIEGLCGLAALPPVGAYFMFLPLKIADATGCPGRAVALVAKP
jgi:isatin hydrolase